MCSTFEDRLISILVHMPRSLESKVRILNLNPSFPREFGSPNFPEYIARDVAIRRSRGEFMISCSSDVILHFSPFDAILHRQFTAFTPFRSPRTEVDNFHWRRFFAGSWTNQHTQVMYLLSRVTGTVLSDFVRVIFKVVVTRCGP
jgi:hypothetical protein